MYRECTLINSLLLPYADIRRHLHVSSLPISPRYAFPFVSTTSSMEFESHCLGSPRSGRTSLNSYLVCHSKTVSELPLLPSSRQLVTVPSLRASSNWVSNQLGVVHQYDRCGKGHLVSHIVNIKSYFEPTTRNIKFQSVIDQLYL
jgi:hypothetical protein